MKKIFSFLCALVVLASASAVPARPVKAVDFSTPRMVKKADLQPKQAAKLSVKKAPAKKQALEVKQPAKFAPVSVNSAARAPKAKQTETNVAVSKVSSTFYQEDNDIYYALYNEDKTVAFCFDIVCAEGENDVVSGQTYTLDDMLAEYCEWVPTDDIYNGTSFTAASFTKTVAADGSFTIVASATDVNGDVWNLSYAGEAFVPQTYDLTMAFESESFYAADNDVYVILRDEAGSDYNYSFTFDIVLPEGLNELVSGQEYTLDDMLDDYSKGADYVNSEYVYYQSVSFVKTIAANGSFTVLVKVIDTKGNTWNLSYAQGAPSVREETLTLEGISDIGTSFSQIEAATADSSIIVDLFIMSNEIAGTFTADDFYAYYTYVAYVDGANLTFYSLAGDASFTSVFNSETNTYAFTGTMLTANDDDPTDQILFTLNLTIAGAAPIEPVDLSFEFEVTDEAVTIIPSNDEDLWDYYFVTPEDLEGYWDNDIDALASDAYDYYGDAYAAAGPRTFTFEALSSALSGEVILVVWGADGRVTTPADSVHLSLPEKECVETDLTFSLSLTETGVKVQTSNEEDPWDSYILSVESFAEDFANDPDAVAEAVFDYFGEAYAEPGSYEFSFADLLEDFDPGEYVLVVWGVNGCINTPAAIITFSLGSAQGIENITLTEQVQKVLVDGQLFIIRDNKMFNVQGAQIR